MPWPPRELRWRAAARGWHHLGKRGSACGERIVELPRGAGLELAVAELVPHGSGPSRRLRGRDAEECEG